MSFFHVSPMFQDKMTPAVIGAGVAALSFSFAPFPLFVLNQSTTADILEKARPLSVKPDSVFTNNMHELVVCSNQYSDLLDKTLTKAPPSEDELEKKFTALTACLGKIGNRYPELRHRAFDKLVLEDLPLKFIENGYFFIPETRSSKTDPDKSFVIDMYKIRSVAQETYTVWDENVNLRVWHISNRLTTYNSDINRLSESENEGRFIPGNIFVKDQGSILTPDQRGNLIRNEGQLAASLIVSADDESDAALKNHGIAVHEAGHAYFDKHERRFGVLPPVRRSFYHETFAQLTELHDGNTFDRDIDQMRFSTKYINPKTEHLRGWKYIFETGESLLTKNPDRYFPSSVSLPQDPCESLKELKSLSPKGFKLLYEDVRKELSALLDEESHATQQRTLLSMISGSIAGLLAWMVCKKRPDRKDQPKNIR